MFSLDAEYIWGAGAAGEATTRGAGFAPERTVIPPSRRAAVRRPTLRQTPRRQGVAASSSPRTRGTHSGRSGGAARDASARTRDGSFA